MGKPFCAVGSGVQVDPILNNRTWQLIEWFNVDENHVNHMIRHSQSPDLNSVKHLGEILESPKDVKKTPIEGISLGTVVFMSPIQLQRTYFKDLGTSSCGLYWPGLILIHYVGFKFSICQSFAVLKILIWFVYYMVSMT